MTVAVRHIGQAVTDFFSVAGDPDGDVVVGEEARSRDDVASGGDSWCDGRLRFAGVGMGRSYRPMGPALWSVLRDGRRSAARDGIT